MNLKLKPVSETSLLLVSSKGKYETMFRAKIGINMCPLFSLQSSRKTVRYEKKIMSMDKHPSIFSCQIEASVFSILQKFCNKQEEMSTSSLPFAVWDVYYLVFSNKKF